MSASNRTIPPRRATDGFATLTADMMERGGATPPPLVESRPDTGRFADAALEASQTFGKRASPVQRLKRSKYSAPVDDSVPEGSKPSGAHPCQITDQYDQKIYAGPERRQRDISPLVERRRTVPARVKVSVRLEQHRHQRLKGAGVLLGRTHQDIMTVALDRYLDDLGVLRGSD